MVGEAIIEYNLETNEIINIDDRYINRQLLSETDGKYVDAIMMDNCIYCLCAQENIVIEFNVDKRKAYIHKVGSKNSRYFKITYDGNCFWLVMKKPKYALIKWNPKNKIYIEYTDILAKYRFNNYPEGHNEFINIVFWNKKVCLIPEMADNAFVFNPNLNSFYSFSLVDNIINGKIKKFKWFIFGKKIDNELYLATNGYGELYCAFSESKIKRYDLMITLEELNERKEMIYYQKSRGIPNVFKYLDTYYNGGVDAELKGSNVDRISGKRIIRYILGVT